MTEFKRVVTQGGYEGIRYSFPNAAGKFDPTASFT